MATEPRPRERRKIQRYRTLTIWGWRYGFRGRGKNGETVFSGELYNSPEARDRGIEVAREICAVGHVVDV